MAIKTITSRANAAFKLLQEITTNPRARREHRAGWIEGERLCEAYLKSNAPAAIAVLARSSKDLAGNADDQVNVALPGISGLAEQPSRVRETWLLDEKLFALISPVETSVGWGLVVPIPSSDWTARAGAKEALAKDSGILQPSDVVVLDRIQDPGNLGTILRSALAAGVRHAWCITGTTDPWSPKAMRSAMGAHFAMSIVTNVPDQQVIDAARKNQLQLLATAHADDAQSLFSPALMLAKPCAWVFGNEAGGVSQKLLASAQRVVIPQSKEIESLNVAAAASICLFEMRRRRVSNA